MAEGEGGPDHNDLQDGSPDLFSIEVSDLTLIAVVGLKNTLKEDIKCSIKNCAKEGASVRVVTPSSKFEAVSFAKQLGIITEESLKKDD